MAMADAQPTEPWGGLAPQERNPPFAEGGLRLGLFRPTGLRTGGMGQEVRRRNHSLEITP